jgi:hypothetical protein
MVELLIVIAIIVGISAFTAAAYFYWLGSQQQSNNEMTVRTVNRVFQRHWNWVVEQAKKETPSAAVLTIAGNDGPRAKALWIKVRLMEAFPATYSEINGSGNPKLPDPINQFLYVNALSTGAPAIPLGQQKYLKTYQSALQSAANSYQDSTIAPNGPSYTESSACLLLSLTLSRGGVSLNVDDIQRYVVDSDGDGISEIVDAYGHPLQFYRFAWGITPLNNGSSASIQGLNPAPGTITSPGQKDWSKNFRLADPLDSSGTLLAWPPVPPYKTASSYRQLYEQLFHPIAIANYPGAVVNYSPAIANYLAPVLVSAGADGNLGLPLPRAATTQLIAGNPTTVPLFTSTGLTPTSVGDEADNTYSFNLKGQ